MKPFFLLACFLQLTSLSLSAQQAYFIDGYHGGIYGHLPQWQTRFMVDKLRQYPDWKINLELEPESWDSISVKDKIAFDEFSQLMNDQSSQGRIEYVNPSYGQSYLYNITGESVVRQFYYGMLTLKRHFPSLIFTTYSSEEPCFTSALPQILTSFGFKYASLKNPETCWGGYTRAHGGELVNWIGSDGSKLTTAPRCAVELLKPNSIWETIACNNSVAYIKSAFQYGIQHPVGMCMQDAGWSCGPDRNGPWIKPAYGKQGFCTGDSINLDLSVQNAPHIETDDINTCYFPTSFETWRGYIENKSIRKTKDDWHFSQEDVLTSLVWGAQILQKVAQEVRISENKIIKTEKLAAISVLRGASVWPENSLDEAWRTLLLSQHHDCWIVPYNRIADRPGGVTWADHVVTWTNNTNDRCNSIMENSISSILRSDPLHSANIQNENYGFTVFNTTVNERKECINIQLPAGWDSVIAYDSKGKIIHGQSAFRPDTTSNLSGRKWLFRVDLPSMGYSSYKIKRNKEAGRSYLKNIDSENRTRVNRLRDGVYKIESDLYRILIDPIHGGVIKSLVAKKIGNKEFVDQKNGKSFSELRGNFFTDGGFHSSTESPADIRILENGPIRVKLQINGIIAGNNFVQLITVTEGQRRIDLNLHINWKNNACIGENPEAIRGFPMRKLFYNDSFKLQTLFPLNLSGQKVYKNAPFDVLQSKLSNTFFNRWDSIKNVVLLNWVDVTDSNGKYGLALLSDETTSYSHGENYPLALTLQYSGTGVFNVDYATKGSSEIKYAIIPHENKWDKAGIWTESVNWNETPVATLTHGQVSKTDTKSKSTGTKAGFSMIQLKPSDCEVSSMIFSGNDLMVRVFNAEGNKSLHKLYFNYKTASVNLVSLNGEIIKNLPVKKDATGRTFIGISMPRFGFRTVLFKHVSSDF